MHTDASTTQWELSTIFLNAHWLFDKLKMTGSKAQMLNGLFLVYVPTPSLATSPLTLSPFQLLLHLRPPHFRHLQLVQTLAPPPSLRYGLLREGHFSEGDGALD
jgi:hypothetical protein